MCGICGEFIPLTSADYHPQVSANLMDRIANRLAKRGPDASGLFQQTPTDNSALSFGHRRLSIIDLSEQSNQPMLLSENNSANTQNRWALVFNGCIYNYRELRHELKKLGAVFHSNSDTEVILHAWRYWGENALRS